MPVIKNEDDYNRLKKEIIMAKKKKKKKQNKKKKIRKKRREEKSKMWNPVNFSDLYLTARIIYY